MSGGSIGGVPDARWIHKPLDQSKQARKKEYLPPRMAVIEIPPQDVVIHEAILKKRITAHILEGDHGRSYDASPSGYVCCPFAGFPWSIKVTMHSPYLTLLGNVSPEMFKATGYTMEDFLQRHPNANATTQVTIVFWSEQRGTGIDHPEVCVPAYLPGA